MPTVAPVFRPGQDVEYRSRYRGRVRWAFPWRVVADDGDLLVLYVADGTRGVWMGRDAAGRYLERWVGDDPPVSLAWRGQALALTRMGDAHSLWLLWTEAWEFRGRYVQLQSPIVRTLTGIDTMDQALDVVVAPDGSWYWKDEDDFAEAQQLGVFSPTEAAAVRAEGERVITAHSWPTGWEGWRPRPWFGTAGGERLAGYEPLSVRPGAR